MEKLWSVAAVSRVFLVERRLIVEYARNGIGENFMSQERSVSSNEVAGERKVELVEPGAEKAALLERSQEIGFTQVLEAGAPHASSRQNTLVLQSSPVDSDLRKVVKGLSADEYLKALENSTPEQLQALIQSFEAEGTAGGSKLFKKIMDVPKGRRSILSSIYWWEVRRPVYTLAVCLSGLPSILILSMFGNGTPAIGAAVIYLFFANICYCLGAPAELVARVFCKEKAENAAPVLLTLGTVFSVLLTVFLQVVILGIMAISSITPRF